MSIWNKILLGLNFVAALAFFYLGTRALKTHQHWRELAGQYEDRVEKAQQREHEVRYGFGWNLDNYEDLRNKIAQLGNGDEGSATEQPATNVPPEQRVALREAESRLHELIVSRGKVWRKCQPDLTTFDRQTGAITVAVGEPEPHRPAAAPEAAEGEGEAAASSWVPVDAPVFVFEEYRPADWSFGLTNPEEFMQKYYLGEFRVKGVDEQTRLVALEPAMLLSAAQKSRIENSTSSWVLYEKMPADSRDAFAGLTNEQLRAILPEATVDQYIADGTLVRDLQQLVDNGQLADLSNLSLEKKVWDEAATQFQLVPLEQDEPYRRPLRDYAYLFRLYHEQTELTDGKLAAVLGDLQALTDPQEGGLPKMQAQVTFREGQRDTLDAILKRHQTEREALAAHRQRLEQKRDELKGKIETAARENWQMAVQITQLQVRAAQQINARTQGRVARSESPPPNSGGN